MCAFLSLEMITRKTSKNLKNEVICVLCLLKSGQKWHSHGINSESAKFLNIHLEMDL